MTNDRPRTRTIAAAIALILCALAVSNWAASLDRACIASGGSLTATARAYACERAP